MLIIQIPTNAILNIPTHTAQFFVTCTGVFPTINNSFLSQRGIISFSFVSGRNDFSRSDSTINIFCKSSQ